jgi:hypothetical protein
MKYRRTKWARRLGHTEGSIYTKKLQKISSKEREHLEKLGTDGRITVH